MKRISDDDSVSVGAVMLVCHSSEGEAEAEAEAEYEGDDGDEMTRMLELEFNGGQKKKKKRRLGVDQVKALEKNFQVENKLDPERKMKLAQDLALHPRQVAVWFQNRRARWKTKQLHRDYSILKSSYDSLKLNLDSLNRDNKALLLQIKDLKSKVESPPSSVPRNIKVDSESDSSAVLLAPNDMSSSASTAQFLKIEEDHNFNFFSDDQPPNLPWYSDHHHWT